MCKKIVVAFDHGGFDLRETVISTVKECGYEVIDVGTNSPASCDFTDHAFLGAQKILSGEAYKGIFVCGSGVGMSLAANKINGIYASVCHDTYSAHQAVEHDDINVLCLGARIIGVELAGELIKAFLGASFNNKENQTRRVRKIHRIEDGTFCLSNNSVRLFEKGQSIWYNGIQRSVLKNGEFARMIKDGEIRGGTSNPSSIRKAILGTSDYDNAILALAMTNKDPSDIFTQLSVEDIRTAAHLFKNLYIESKGLDGYVCLEVKPTISSDREATIAEAKKLWKAVNRPNLMITIPGTEEALPAITELTRCGINLNITLIFSAERYKKIAEAYIAGLEARLADGLPIEQVRSVASVFISRIDTKVDTLLEQEVRNGNDDAKSLMGKAAIYNAKNIYNTFCSIFNGERFAALRSKGANVQRLLWDSTSTKNSNYSNTQYIESLIGPNTVNTVSPDTLKALLANLSVSQVLPEAQAEIDLFFSKLEAADIHLNQITEMLEKDGIAAFEKDYSMILDDLSSLTEHVRSSQGKLTEQIQSAAKKMEEDSIISRMFSKDPTVWTFDTQAFAEIRNRLGWLDACNNTEKSLQDYQAVRTAMKEEGINKILLLGMGGSSLAPEVMADIFDDETDIKLTIVDSTDPDQVLAADKAHKPEETLYIVSSKSGTTAEVRAYLDYFYHRAQEDLGEKAGHHFAAITDPGTLLERLSSELSFRKTFISDPAVGGRFSALTPFGMVPAVLMGLDAEKIVSKAVAMAKICSPSTPLARNEGAALGIFMGTAALNGMDKVTILTDPAFNSFGSWLEQLIAESSGKLGKGIVPVDIEPNENAANYSDDRVFVYISLNGEKQGFVDSITDAGHPVYTIRLEDKYDLFAEFYRWEIAISVACSMLQVNAFDQPNVQDSKTRTVAKVNEYHEKGSLVQPAYNWTKNGISAFLPEGQESLGAANSVSELISAFIKTATPGVDYIAINAYLPRNEKNLADLQQVRAKILAETKCATTLGFGPRFQHSTGQLHKGGANNGLFIQLVADYGEDAEIPNEDITFSVLERAQALGDFESLLANHRRAVRIDLGKNSIGSLFA